MPELGKDGEILMSRLCWSAELLANILKWSSELTADSPTDLLSVIGGGFECPSRCWVTFRASWWSDHQSLAINIGADDVLPDDIARSNDGRAMDVPIDELAFEIVSILMLEPKNEQDLAAMAPFMNVT